MSLPDGQPESVDLVVLTAESWGDRVRAFQRTIEGQWRPSPACLTAGRESPNIASRTPGRGSSVVFRWSWRPAGAGAPTSSVRRTKEGWGRGRGRQRLEKRNKIIDISNQRASYWVCHPVSACHTKNYCRLGSFPRAVEVCRPAQAHETRGPFVHVPFPAIHFDPYVV